MPVMQAVSFVDVTKPIQTLGAKAQMSFSYWYCPVHSITHPCQERTAARDFQWRTTEAPHL